MKINQNIYAIFIIIIICIIGRIIYIYINTTNAANNTNVANNTNAVKNGKQIYEFSNLEHFYGTADIRSPEEQQEALNAAKLDTSIPTYPTFTLPDTKTFNVQPVTTNSNDNNDININTPDTIINNIVEQSLKDLEINLKRFSNLDAPIIINDNGQQCTVWANYNNGKYKINDNNCIIVDNTNNRKCLGTNSMLSTCNNLYNDGYINQMNNINILPLVSQARAEILFNIGNTSLNLNTKSTKIDTIINDLVTKRNLEIQQLYFINYNTENLQDKEHNITKINKNVIEKQKEVNLNQAIFSQFTELNSNTDNINKFYYKITIGLIVVIIIVGLINLISSNIL